MSESSQMEVQDSLAPGVIPETTHVQRAHESSPQETAVQSPGPPAPGVEPRGARLVRRAHRVRLYLYAFFTVAVLVYVVALAASNTHRVRVDWIFARSSVALIWLVTLAAILGWLLGLVVAAVFRWRTRAPGGPS
jgi:uncharacterized integral membrane protein